MAYVVQGTSAGGTTTVERETVEAAFGVAREMQHASYADISVQSPTGERTCLAARVSARHGATSGSVLPGRV